MIPRTDLYVLRHIDERANLSRAELDYLSGLVETDRAEVLGIKQIIEESMPEVSRLTPDIQIRRAERQKAFEDLELLARGFGAQSGVANPALLIRCDQPGLAELDKFAQRLAFRRERLQADQWTTEKRPFRYIGKPNKSVLGEPPHFLEPGEVIFLTKSQAKSFADRFEPVREEQPTS